MTMEITCQTKLCVGIESRLEVCGQDLDCLFTINNSFFNAQDVRYSRNEGSAI
jgi:hypothetical protein